MYSPAMMRADMLRRGGGHPGAHKLDHLPHGEAVCEASFRRRRSQAAKMKPLGHRNLVEGYMIELAVTLAEGGVNRCVHR
jgi:hypothetical protein